MEVVCLLFTLVSASPGITAVTAVGNHVKYIYTYKYIYIYMYIYIRTMVYGRKGKIGFEDAQYFLVHMII